MYRSRSYYIYTMKDTNMSYRINVLRCQNNRRRSNPTKSSDVCQVNVILKYVTNSASAPFELKFGARSTGKVHHI